MPKKRVPSDATDTETGMRSHPAHPNSVLSTIEEAITDIRAGRMVILIDDEDRENEGDLCMAAEAVTPEAINFMARFGRGLICLPMTEAQLTKLRLPMMVPDHENSANHVTGFTVSIEAREGVLRAALSNSFGFGGTNVALALTAV